MRFAHFSDCHLGSWNNHPELREISTKTFEASIDRCIAEGVDFIVISGDLFDTSLPPLDIVRRAVVKFRQCKDSGIMVYAIPGSHDFSPTGKTFLSVLEDAGLLTDVSKTVEENGRLKLQFAIDPKTGAKITGMPGRMGGLEHRSFELLDGTAEQETGFKIFLFHSAIEEYKPPHMKEMKAISLELLPKNFSYYAAGHVHVRHESAYSNAKIIFPGPTFPTEFTELENFCAGFYLADTAAGTAVPCDINLCSVELVRLDATNKTPQGITQELHRMVPSGLENKILLLRIDGVIDGKIADIDFQSVVARATELGAIAVKKNISKLTSKEIEAMSVNSDLGIAAIENELVLSNVDKIRFPSSMGDEEDTIFSLMDALNDEKQEGETNSTFEERIKQNAKKLLGI